MDSPFMATIAEGLASRHLRVVRFEFSYMRRRRTEGTRTTPEREPILLDRWREVIDSMGAGQHLVIGGKSLGGRIASMGWCVSAIPSTRRAKHPEPGSNI